MALTMNPPETSNPETRVPTHDALSPEEMARLARLVESAAKGQEITADLIDALAEEHDVDASALYVSAATLPHLVFARQHKVAFVVCGGACQGWGARECLDTLVTLRARRRKKWFKKAFDIQAKSCLNGCEHAPMIRVHTRDGVAYMQRATPEDLTEAVKDLCG